MSITEIPDARGVRMAGGRLDFRKLLEGFREFWEACVGILPDDGPFDGQAALCIALAYLQRITNFGGTAIPDYGLHHDETRILTFNAFIGKDGQAALQRELVEIRVWHPGDADPLTVRWQTLTSRWPEPALVTDI